MAVAAIGAQQVMSMRADFAVVPLGALVECVGMSDRYSHGKIKIGSERSFGLVFAVVFAIVAAWPLLSGSAPRIWASALAGLFAAGAFLAPHLYRPTNLLWAKFGMLLGRIVAPLVMALVFFVAVTPTGWVLWLLGKDPLRRKFDPQAKSYWMRRDPAASGFSMRKQF